jgi:hypothetical protein
MLHDVEVKDFASPVLDNPWTPTVLIKISSDGCPGFPSCRLHGPVAKCVPNGQLKISAEFLSAENILGDPLYGV